MTEIQTFSNDDVNPGRAAVLLNQGVPPGAVLRPEIEALLTTALDLLIELAAPAGILREISNADFDVVYHGQGRNEPRTPVGDIFGKAENLTLFAVTLGQRISHRIEERFASNDFALAAMLDSAASAAADKLADVIERRSAEHLAQTRRATPESGVLGYSPGYCGWDITGQKKLFEFLHPEQIGISLTNSCLMQPLKSVSGVVIAAPKDIHDFEMSYPYCKHCEKHGCRERIRTLLAV